MYLLPPRYLLRGLIGLSQLIPVNRRSLAVTHWQIKPRTDEFNLEIFQEVQVEPSLLGAIVISVVLLRSGHSLGDSLGEISLTDLIYYFQGLVSLNDKS